MPFTDPRNPLNQGPNPNGQAGGAGMGWMPGQAGSAGSSYIPNGPTAPVNWRGQPTTTNTGFPSGFTPPGLPASSTPRSTPMPVGPSPATGGNNTTNNFGGDQSLFQAAQQANKNSFYQDPVPGVPLIPGLASYNGQGSVPNANNLGTMVSGYLPGQPGYTSALQSMINSTTDPNIKASYQALLGQYGGFDIGAKTGMPSQQILANTGGQGGLANGFTPGAQQPVNNFSNPAANTTNGTTTSLGPAAAQSIQQIQPIQQTNYGGYGSWGNPLQGNPYAYMNGISNNGLGNFGNLGLPFGVANQLGYFNGQGTTLNNPLANQNNMNGLMQLINQLSMGSQAGSGYGLGYQYNPNIIYGQ